MLDPNIILQAGRGVTPLVDPVELQMRFQALKNAQRQGQIQDMQQQKLQQGFQDDQAVRQAVQANTIQPRQSTAIPYTADPTTGAPVAGTPGMTDGGFNEHDLISAVQKTGNLDLMMTLQNHFAAQKLAKVQAQQAQIKQHMADLDTLDKLTAASVDEPTYQSAIATARSLGLPTQNMPPNYDPSFMATTRNRLMGVKEQAEMAFKQSEAQRKAAEASSPIGKIQTDLQAGLITQAQADAAIRHATNIAPGMTVQVGGGAPSTTPEQRSSRATQIANGEIPLVKPTRGDSTALRDMADARQIMVERGQDPNDLPGLYESKRKGQTSWASGQVNAKTVTALNTAVDHMGVLQKAGAALKNGEWQTANKITNAIGVNMGNNEKTNFDAVATFLAGEIDKVVSGNNPTLEGTRNARAMFPAEGSNAQIGGAIEKAKQILGGKLNALNLEHKNAFNGSSLTDRKRLTPAAIAAFQGVLGDHEAPKAGGATSADELMKLLGH